MSLFGGKEVKPSTVAQEALSNMTRKRYDRLQELYAPVETAALRAISDPETAITYAGRDAGRTALDQTKLIQDTAAYDVERRGINVSDADQAVIDRRNTYTQKVNERKAKTAGTLAASAAMDQNVAGVVDAGNSMVSRGFASLQQAAQMEAQQNSQEAGTRAGLLEKISGVASGALAGFAAGGAPGAIAGAGLASAQYF